MEITYFRIMFDHYELYTPYEYLTTFHLLVSDDINCILSKSSVLTKYIDVHTNLRRNYY